MMIRLLVIAFSLASRRTQAFTSRRMHGVKLGYPACLLVSVLAGILAGNGALAQDTTVSTGQQAVVEIVRLQYRSPDMVREMISPSLDRRGAISQIDNNLIISTSRANLAQLQPLINLLDVPLRQLRISIDFAYGEPVMPAAPDIPSVGTEPAASLQATGEFLQQWVEMMETQVVLFSVHSDTPIVFSAGMVEQSLIAPPVQVEEQIGFSVEIRADRAVLSYARIDARNRFDMAAWSHREIGIGQWIELESAITAAINTTAIPFGAPQMLAMRVDLLP